MTGSNAVIHNFRNLMNLDSGITGFKAFAFG